MWKRLTSVFTVIGGNTAVSQGLYFTFSRLLTPRKCNEISHGVHFGARQFDHSPVGYGLRAVTDRTRFPGPWPSSQQQRRRRSPSATTTRSASSGSGSPTCPAS